MNIARLYVCTQRLPFLFLYVVGASLCWWITAVLIHKLPDASEDSFPAPVATPAQAAAPLGASAPPGTVTVTEQVLPDGTKKTTKTTVNADGSKTVEETVTAAAGPY